MATKSKGVGRGGARAGAGRKSKPVPDDPQIAFFAEKSVEELMEIAVRILAARGRWDDASKAGARLLNARSRGAVPGKKAQRQSAAEALTQNSLFAPPPPPKMN